MGDLSKAFALATLAGASFQGATTTEGWRADPLGAALEIIADTPDPVLRAREMARTYLALLEAGLPHEAERVLAVAVDEAEEVAEPTSRADALYKMAGLVAEAQEEVALGLLERAVEAGEGLWPPNTSRAYGAGRLSLSLGAPALAERLWERFEESQRAVFRAHYLSGFLLEGGDKEGARELVLAGLAAVRDTYAEGGQAIPSMTLGSFARLLDRTGDRAGALALLVEAADPDKASVSGSIVLARDAVGLGDGALARRIVDDLYAAVLEREAVVETAWWRGGFENWWRMRVRGQDLVGRARDFSLMRVAAGYAAIGQFDRALGLAQYEVHDAKAKSWAYYFIADEFARRGEAERAWGMRLGVPADEELQAAFINATGQAHLAAGRPQEAWAVWRLSETDHGVLAQAELLDYWQAQGDLDSLSAYMDRTPFRNMQAMAGERVASILRSRGLFPSDRSILAAAAARVGAGEADLAPYDDMARIRALAKIAPAQHTAGDHEGALATLERAEALVRGLAWPCEHRVFFDWRRFRLRDPCLEERLQRPTDNETAKARHWALLADAYSWIGETERALSLVEMTGPPEESWRVWPGNDLPRLEALRAVGVALAAAVANGPQALPADDAAEGAG